MAKSKKRTKRSRAKDTLVRRSTKWVSKHRGQLITGALTLTVGVVTGRFIRFGA